MTRVSFLIAALFFVSACGAAKTPALACTDLCTGAGFTGGTSDVQSNETNCFCTGGSGTISDSACATMCTQAGKGSSTAFKSGAGVTTANACQCQ